MWLVVRVVEFTHFTRDRRPKRLTVDEFEPTLNDKGYPSEGSFILSIDDGEGRKSFGLSEAEAALLVIRLWNVLVSHGNDFMNLWALRKGKEGKDGE